MQKELLDINKSEDAKKIVDGCVRNDRYYQQILYTQTYKKMLGACMRYSSDVDEAKDFLQDGYVKVFDKIKFYKEIGSLEAWVKRIIINNLIDSMRKSSKMKFVDLESNPISEKDDSENELALIEESAVNASRIMDLLHQLTPAYRMAFNMFVIEDFSHKQIAEMLNISVGTSKSNLAKAKLKLKEMYVSKYGSHYE